MVEDENYKYSEFNSAALKMRRLDKIISDIQEIDHNLAAWNIEYGDYNYMLKLRKLENLFQEVESKLTEDEQKAINKMRAAISFFINRHPVYTTKQQKIYPYEIKKTLNKATFLALEEFLSEYESQLRRLIDSHGMDTVYDQDDDL